MCGRYTLTVTLEELLLRYSVDSVNAPFHEPRYNISPSQMVITVLNDGQNNRIGKLKWGLTPPWAKDLKTSTINARAETLLQKSSFKIPFLKKRCLIPADSFFEWKPTANGKQPMRIMMNSEEIFSFAGIYETWTGSDGTKVSGVAVITTEPNQTVSEIHNRMPLILKPEDEKIWLDRTVQDPSVLMPLLQPYSADQMKCYAVSTEVGNVKNDSKRCIKELV
ncbi:SOS response-associated peptidase [Paenibacillus sp. R14(2021)]|uniref:SOS response-associated peptidase n=1 Tax=Paenibacillus sp. R14(2021) TaxID=2859228 RepID=UPI001C612CDA|nr:SOS response-associated peptidase [Paenibacillus sp. R14(2021)]